MAPYSPLPQSAVHPLPQELKVLVLVRQNYKPPFPDYSQRGKFAVHVFHRLTLGYLLTKCRYSYDVIICPASLQVPHELGKPGFTLVLMPETP